MNQDTLWQAIEKAESELSEYRAIPAENWIESFQFGGIPYGTHKEAHFALSSYKGKPTKKYGHVTITRMDSGRYEVVVYIL